MPGRPGCAALAPRLRVNRPAGGKHSEHGGISVATVPAAAAPVQKAFNMSSRDEFAETPPDVPPPCSPLPGALASPGPLRVRTPHTSAELVRVCKECRRVVQTGLYDDDAHAVVEGVERLKGFIVAFVGDSQPDLQLSAHATALADERGGLSALHECPTSVQQAFRMRLNAFPKQEMHDMFYYHLRPMHPRVVGFLLRSGLTDAALSYVACLPVAAGRLQTSVVSEVMKHGSSSTMASLLQLRRLLGLPLDRYAFSTIAAAAVRRGESNLLGSLLAMASTSGITMDMYTCNTLLNIHAKGQDPERFHAVWNDMLQQGIRPDAVSYSTKAKLLAATAEHPVAAVRRLVRDVAADAPEALSPHLFTVLFSAVQQRGGRFRDLLGDWRLMRATGVPLSNRIVSSFLSAAKGMELAGRDVETCYGIVLELRRQEKLQVGVLTNILLLCCNNNFALRVLDIWTLASKDKLRLNSAVLKAMLKCATAVHSTAFVDPFVPRLVRKIHALMDTQWNQQAEQGGEGLRGGPPTPLQLDWLSAYNTLLRYYAAAQDWEQGSAVFQFMKESLVLDICAYNAMLCVCGHNAQASAAHRLLGEMRRNGLQPDIISYGSAMHACAQASEVGRALSLLREMQGQGLTPNNIVMTSAIDACVSEGSAKSLAMAMRLYRDMQSQGIPPTDATYCCLLTSCIKTGDAAQAMRLYREAISRATPLSDGLHHALVRCCIRTEHLDAMLDEVQGMLAAPALCSLLRALCGQQLDAAQGLLEYMRARCMPVDPTTYHALVFSHAQEGEIGCALRLYLEARAEGHPSATHSTSQLIQALGKVREVTGALLVLRDMLECARGCCGPSATLERLQSVHPDATAALCLSPMGAGMRPWVDHVPPEDAEALVDGLRPLEVFRTAHEAVRPAGLPRLADGGVKAPRGRRRKDLARGDMLPTMGAVATVVLGLSLEGYTNAALRLYDELLSLGDHIVVGLAQDHTRMFEQLIESSCRRGDLATALHVFDDWKPARDRLLQRHRRRDREQDGNRAAALEVPELSNATLAYLESCCHSHSESDDLQWRVYDVCAFMRQQRQDAHDMELPKPRKKSHHFKERTRGL